MTQYIITLCVVFATLFQIFLGVVAIAAVGWYPRVPAGINWFAVGMIAMNLGAAVYATVALGSINQLIYGLSAAVLNLCVYFDFDKIIKMTKEAL